MSFFVRCLTEEVINIPTIQPFYMVQFQRLSVEQGQQMIAQLRQLHSDQRQAMMALLELAKNGSLLDKGKGPPALAEPSSDVRVLSVKKETMQVQLVILTTGERFELEIPADALVGHLLPVLAKRLGIPLRLENNWPVSYRLYNETSGRDLDNDLTFRQNGVSDGDILAFHFNTLYG